MGHSMLLLDILRIVTLVVSFICFTISYVLEKKKANAEPFFDLGTIFIIFAISLYAYEGINYLIANPGIGVMVFWIFTIVVMSLVSTHVPTRILVRKEIIPATVHRYLRSYIIRRQFLFQATIVTGVMIVQVIILQPGVIISGSTLHWFYSTVSQVFGTLLGIIGVFIIFMIQRRETPTMLKKILVDGVKRISLLYGFTLSLSIFAILIIPKELALNFSAISCDAVPLYLFLTISVLIIMCIVYLITLFFEVSV